VIDLGAILGFDFVDLPLEYFGALVRPLMANTTAYHGLSHRVGLMAFPVL